MNEITVIPPSNGILSLDEIDNSIARAGKFSEMVDIQKRIDIILEMAKIADASLDMVNEINVRRLAAIRKGGQILATLPRGINQYSAPDTLSGAYQQAIAESSVTERTARRWQRAGCISDDDFDKYIDEMIEKSCELTLAGLIRFAGEAQTKVTDSSKSIRIALEALIEMLNRWNKGGGDKGLVILLEDDGSGLVGVTFGDGYPGVKDFVDPHLEFATLDEAVKIIHDPPVG